MSCNGCRVLRKGCSESCVLRTCLRWIDSPESQGYATLFLAKFFGRSDLLSFVSAVPENQRPALFRSLLFEACGRTVNPVSGAVGLLSSGNWHVCNAAVQTVLSGGVLRPLPSAGVDQLTSRGGGAVQNNNNNNNNNNLYYASVPSAHEGRSVQQPLDVGLSLAAAAGGRSGRGRSSCAVANKRMRDTVSLDSEESVMTTSFQRGGSGGGDSNGDGSKLLKLFF